MSEGPDEPGRPQGSSVLVFLGVGLVLLALAASGFVWIEKVKAGASRKRCTANLKQIGLGFNLYQQQNDDFLPDRDGLALVSALYETGHLDDPGVYLCPQGDEEPATRPWLDRTSCSYTGRLNTGPNRLTSGLIAKFGSRTLLAADWNAETHEPCRNVLFADGHVEEIDESVYQATYAPVMGR